MYIIYKCPIFLEIECNLELTREQKDRRIGYETPDDVVGFRAFKSVSSVDALNATLSEIYDRMPEMFKKSKPQLNDIQFSESNGYGGITYNDMLTIGKRFFVTNYLGIDVEKWMDDPDNDEYVDFEGIVEAVTGELALHKTFDIFREEGTPVMVKRDLTYVLPDRNSITAGDVFEGIYDVTGMNRGEVRKIADLTFKNFGKRPYEESFGGRRIQSALGTAASSAPATGAPTRRRAYDRFYGLASIAAGICVVAASAAVGAITGN